MRIARKNTATPQPPARDALRFLRAATVILVFILGYYALTGEPGSTGFRSSGPALNLLLMGDIRTALSFEQAEDFAELSCKTSGFHAVAAAEGEPYAVRLSFGGLPGEFSAGIYLLGPGTPPLTLHLEPVSGEAPLSLTAREGEVVIGAETRRFAAVMHDEDGRRLLISGTVWCPVAGDLAFRES